MIAALVSSPAGHCVSFDQLEVYRLEDGRYVVNTSDPVAEAIFDDPMLAAAEYIARRHEMKLGFDYEVCRREKST